MFLLSHEPVVALYSWTLDGIVVNFGTPAEHAFAPALDALCGVVRDRGLAR
ncbi:MAG: hypothetical protein WCB92_04950 [Mycobacterium sp.]